MHMQSRPLGQAKEAMASGHFMINIFSATYFQKFLFV